MKRSNGGKTLPGFSALSQLNVAVTVVSVSKSSVQVPVPVQPPDQPPNVEGETGLAVRVTAVPDGKLSTQLTFVLEQVKPEVVLATTPVPLPEKLTVRTGSEPPLPPLPLPVKQTTFTVISPVTIAPDEDTPEPSWFVVTVAETRPPPQRSPVATKSPVELTVAN